MQLPRGLQYRVSYETIRGLIGCDVLKKFVVSIDYGALTVTLADPRRFKPDTKALRMLMVMGGRRPAMSAQFDGRVGIFLVDTGNSGWPELKRSFVKRSRLEAAYSNWRSLAGEAAGDQTVEFYQVCMHDVTIM